MTTLRQVHANQQNALKSTGPRTEAGKEVARANALKHGLSATVVLPEDETQAVHERLVAWHADLRPEGVNQEWLAEQVVAASVRIDHCQQLDRSLRIRQSCRASTCWDDDRRLAAARLGRRLAKQPSVVALELRQTPQGCDWLIERWRGLDEALRSSGTLDEGRTAQALDLLGIPAENRDGRTPLTPAEGVDARSCHESLIAAQIEDLERHKAEVAAVLDAFDRETTELGLGAAPEPGLRQVRRFEAASLRRMNGALAELRQAQARCAEEELSKYRDHLRSSLYEYRASREPARQAVAEPSAPSPIAGPVSAPIPDQPPASEPAAPAPAPPAEVPPAPPCPAARTVAPAVAFTGKPLSMSTTVSAPPMNRHNRRALESLSRRG